MISVAAGGDELVLLAKFSHAHEAEAARAALEAEEIPAFVQHAHGAIVTVGTWVTLWVPKRYLETARRALEEDSRRLELPPDVEVEDAEMIRRGKIVRGVRLLLATAIAVLVFGILQSLAAAGEIDRWLAAGAGRPDGDRAAPGVTVGQIRELASLIKVGFFVVTGVVAAAFVGLYVWARRSPIPALSAGAALLLAVQGLQALAAGAGLVPSAVGWKLGNLIWTLFFLATWVQAIREARSGVNDRSPRPG